MAQQVKFEEKETIRTTQNVGGRNGGPATRGPPEKQDFAHKVGDALTAGAGPGGYLAVRAIQ